ncbi:hypothetical protein [uncultured Sunxiuqinia sp.]|uniref:hypothetical protein n=1 Tax=uncultured Sunxiuqinia sp. TaxID=1573825 RepID=UPI0030DD6AC6|tara:strand:- start:82584 stop:82835 length:252 start_codon:yes stop_codon:yes gene_type:complete
MIKSDSVLASKLEVLVFRTNINNQLKVDLIIDLLSKTEGVHSIHVDLEDWEKILRIECHPGIAAKDIEIQMARLGVDCSELEE